MEEIMGYITVELNSNSADNAIKDVQNILDKFPSEIIDTNIEYFSFNSMEYNIEDLKYLLNSGNAISDNDLYQIQIYFLADTKNYDIFKSELNNNFKIIKEEIENSENIQSLKIVSAEKIFI